MNINGRAELTAKPSRPKPDAGSFHRLRTAALIAVLAGAAGSVALMLRAGHRNPSRILLALFAFWVLSPFIALVWAHSVSKRWQALTRATLYGMMMLLTLGSVAIYAAVALGPPRAKTAFVFVVVPPASWLLIAIALSIAALVSRKQIFKAVS